MAPHNLPIFQEMFRLGTHGKVTTYYLRILPENMR